MIRALYVRERSLCLDPLRLIPCFPICSSCFGASAAWFPFGNQAAFFFLKFFFGVCFGINGVFWGFVGKWSGGREIVFLEGKGLILSLATQKLSDFCGKLCHDFLGFFRD